MDNNNSEDIVRSLHGQWHGAIAVLEVLLHPCCPFEVTDDDVARFDVLVAAARKRLAEKKRG